MTKPGKAQKIGDFLTIIAAVTAAVGSVCGVIFLAAMQWSDVQAATKEIPGIIAWKNQTNTDLAVMKNNLQELHDWYARDNGKVARP